MLKFCIKYCLSACVLPLLLSLSSFAQTTLLTGQVPTYKGDKITFYTYSDYITLQPMPIGIATVDTSGFFSIHVQLAEPIFIFTYLGIYKGHLHIEPGKEYRLILPDKQEKTPAEQSNPYFEYTEFMIGISDGDMDDINFLIKTFDNSYYPYFNKLAMNLNSKVNPKELERAIEEMQKPWLAHHNEYFKNYIQYRIGMLRLLAFQYKTKAISEEYFSNKKILYNHIAYMELFRQVYDKYFIFFSNTAEGKPLYDDINIKKSYVSLKKTLRTDNVLINDTLLELVVLKNIYDAFYSDKFSREALLVVLDSLSSITVNTRHKVIATTIRENVTRLMPGFQPPAFSLPDRNDNMISLSDFKGQYVYLNFCSCSSYGCFKEFNTLQKFYEKYKEKIVIITIICDGTPKEMKNYLSRNNYNWIFLHCAGQKEIMDKYRIKAYPVYFFIDKEGKTVYSPALSPGENFEAQFQKYLKSKGEI